VQRLDCADGFGLRRRPVARFLLGEGLNRGFDPARPGISRSPAPKRHNTVEQPERCFLIPRGMAMTLRLPADLEEALRVAAAEDHRSVQQEVTHAVETYLARRETEEIKSDPETLRALAEARESVQSGDVVFGTEAARALVRDRTAS
jgi:plasmid stability protein